MRNTCAQTVSDLRIGLRLDRYLLHKLPNLSYSIEHLNMIGLETIPIDSINNKYMNQSDHYGLQLIIHFRIRTISQRSALILLPTINEWLLIQSFREKYDSLFSQWPPYIKLLWPFFDLINTEDNDEEDILLPLRLLLARNESFDIRINEIDSSIENPIRSFMQLNQQSAEDVKQLYEHIQELFSRCLFNNECSCDSSMTMAQFDTKNKKNQVKSLFSK